MKSKTHETHEKYLKVIEIVKDDDIAVNLLKHLINKICEHIEIVCKKNQSKKKKKVKKHLYLHFMLLTNIAQKNLKICLKVESFLFLYQQ